MRRALALTLASVSLCAAVVTIALAQEGEDTPRLDPTQPPPAQPPAPPRELTDEDRARRAKVVARVGEARITVGEVEDAINEQSPFMRVRYRDPEALRTFVQSMIRFELLARAAEREEIANDAEVQRVVKQNAVQQLIRTEFDERITPESISDADVEEYYRTHPDEFSRPELRRAAHIQLASREEAERLMTKARGADAREFRQLARDHSVDPETRLRGGDLRYFDEEGGARNRRDPQVDEALARAAFALAEVGDMAAEPIQVGERWSILKLTGRRPAEHRSLEQATPTIRLRLWRERRQQAMEDFVARLRREANVQVDYDLMRPIRLDPPEGDEEGEEASEHGKRPPGPTGAPETTADEPSEAASE